MDCPHAVMFTRFPSVPREKATVTSVGTPRASLLRFFSSRSYFIISLGPSRESARFPRVPRFSRPDGVSVDPRERDGRDANTWINREEEWMLRRAQRVPSLRAETLPLSEGITAARLRSAVESVRAERSTPNGGRVRTGDRCSIRGSLESDDDGDGSSSSSNSKRQV